MEQSTLRLLRTKLVHANGKLRRAEVELRRTERSVAFWRRRVTELQQQHVEATQLSLWDEKELITSRPLPPERSETFTLTALRTSA